MKKLDGTIFDSSVRVVIFTVIPNHKKVSILLISRLLQTDLSTLTVFLENGIRLLGVKGVYL